MRARAGVRAGAAGGEPQRLHRRPGALPRAAGGADAVSRTEAPPATALVEVDGLTVDFWATDRWVNVVDRVSLAIQPGEAYGLVGESGCGKTTTAVSLLGVRRPGSRVRAG